MRFEKVKNKKGKEKIRSGTKHLKTTREVKENPLVNKFVNKIVCGDSEETLKKIPNNSIDLVITSPPYNFGHSYANDPDQDTQEWKVYFDKLSRVWKECYRVLKPGGRLAVNIQPLFSDYIPTHHLISSQLLDLGFLWKAEILWEKNNYNAKYTAWGSWKSPSMPYLKYTWEFIEVFAKDSHKKLGQKENIDITDDEFKEWVYAKWKFAPESKMREFGHPAMFPEELPRRIMKLFSYKGDLILDPFNGVGTSTLVAFKLKRRFIGIDISSGYCETSMRRIADIAKQKTLFEEGTSTNYPLPKVVSTNAFDKGKNL